MSQNSVRSLGHAGLVVTRTIAETKLGRQWQARQMTHGEVAGSEGGIGKIMPITTVLLFNLSSLQKEGRVLAIPSFPSLWYSSHRSNLV